ncbi:MAG: hypothetical protein AAB116_01320, partial [Candidatus Poribacteria bacterium]
MAAQYGLYFPYSLNVKAPSIAVRHAENLGVVVLKQNDIFGIGKLQRFDFRKPLLHAAQEWRNVFWFYDGVPAMHHFFIHLIHADERASA